MMPINIKADSNNNNNNYNNNNFNKSTLIDSSTTTTNCSQRVATQIKHCKMRYYQQMCTLPPYACVTLFFLVALLEFANCHNLVAQAPTTYGVQNVMSRQMNYASNQAEVEVPKNRRPQRSAQPADIHNFDILSLKSAAREDICSGHCSCINKPLTAITCDYRTNYQLSPMFDSRFQVPTDTTHMRIMLGPKTQFVLYNGFFNKNKVNSFIIEGLNSGNSQVEITSDAFSGNFGPFPEIQIINVSTVFLRSRAIIAETQFTVRGANELILFTNTFMNASIHGFFKDIKDLQIQEQAFNSTIASIVIENSNIDSLHRFEASLRAISFINCNIGTINGGTFDVNNIGTISFENCRIDTIKSKAITEKLLSNHLLITDANIKTIETEAIYGGGISEFILTRNSIDTIQSNAIDMSSINVTIADNNIKHLENNWLLVKEWSNVTIANNQFGVFGQMLLKDIRTTGSCRFERNSLTKPLPGSLRLSNHHCSMHEISVNMPCRCNLNWLQALSTQDLKSQIYCTIDDKLSNCFNASTLSTQQYLHRVCNTHDTVIDCGANRNLKKLDGRFFTSEELERRNQYLPHTITLLVAGSIVLLVLLVIVCILSYRLYHKRAKAAQVSQDNHCHHFSAEDRHIIEHTLQHMQKKYPKIHRSVQAKTQLLLQSNLSSKKCNKVVMQIENILHGVKNTGHEFAVFSNMLAQHLEPHLPSAPPPNPIYTEPGFAAVEQGDFYTLNTAQPAYAETTAVPNTVLNEHIYAEPNCAQQPLLPSDYALPADVHKDVNDPYMEPVNEIELNSPHVAYAVSKPIVRNQQQRLPALPMPKRAGTNHLPDVLQQHNKPLTNVQIMAQDLQRTPNFHLNQPRPHHLHFVAPPVYTLPDTSHKHQSQIVAENVAMKSKMTARLASPEAVDDCELDMRGATALPPDSGSDHSGGSDETVKIDDVIQYVDA